MGRGSGGAGGGKDRGNKTFVFVLALVLMHSPPLDTCRVTIGFGRGLGVRPFSSVVANAHCAKHMVGPDLRPN